MKLGVIGVGQAGGKLVDGLLAYERQVEVDFLPMALAVNTARADLLGLARVPMKARLVVGQSRVKGNGVGANNELGARVMLEDIEEVMGAVAAQPTEDVDAFLVVAGLGGGTGSGGAPVVARELGERYTEPIYGLAALPSRAEGGIYQLNAARSFKTFVTEVDNLLVADNDAWQQPGAGSLTATFGHINREVARRLGILLTASESYGPQAPEMVVDASEIMNTLGVGGISTIGYATSPVSVTEPGFFDVLFERDPPPTVDESETANQIASLVRMATLSNLSLPCNIASAERALVVVAGPPAYLSRKGLETAVTWLEEETGTLEVRGGDCPLPDEEKVAALVVLSGVTDVPRLDELRTFALRTQRRVAELDEEHAEAFLDLFWAGDEELERLY